MFELSMTHSDHGHTCHWSFPDRDSLNRHRAEYMDAGWFVRTIREMPENAPQTPVDGAKPLPAPATPTAGESRQAGFRAALWQRCRDVPEFYRPQAAAWLAGYDLFSAD